ncbi:MAG TPA: molybdenum cofactor biosynthesis protein MoaE, partial [Planctomycetaceae bacterium]|nr:molybdenum cofactor biosynthesis protein MoaE [Planctomycetaceae bacterium]
RRTLALDYDAHAPMAQAKLEQLEAEAREKWPLDRVSIVHRLGHMAVGEVSVAVAVSSPHRQPAFEAAKYLIDRLKQVVPIWKRENWSDGTSEWVHPGMEEGATFSDSTDLPSSPCHTNKVRQNDARKAR